MKNTCEEKSMARQEALERRDWVPEGPEVE